MSETTGRRKLSTVQLNFNINKMANIWREDFIANAFFFFMSLLVAVEKVFWLHAVFKENPSQLSINLLEQSGCISLLVDRGYKDIRHIINNFTKRLFSNLFLTTFCNLKLPSKYKCSKIRQKYNISYNCIKLCVFQDIYVLTICWVKWKCWKSLWFESSYSINGL